MRAARCLEGVPEGEGHRYGDSLSHSSAQAGVLPGVERDVAPDYGIYCGARVEPAHRTDDYLGRGIAGGRSVECVLMLGKFFRYLNDFSRMK